MPFARPLETPRHAPHVTPRATILPEGGAAAWALEELTPAGAGSGDAAPPAEAPALLQQRQAEEEARQQAERQAELERATAQAYAAGVAAGEQRGRAEATARLASAVAAAEAALERIRDGERRWEGALDDNVCALTVAIARQVIGRELAGDPATLTDLVRRALAEFPVDQPVQIRVNPADLAALATQGGAAGQAAGAPGGTAAVAPNREARWIADPSVAVGGCLVEGRERIVDGRVDTALERIYRKLTGNHA
ncbi:MAG TPA: FliH/SctL family protein [Gemmatimonadaceae bacterium]|nr:FliH/SctL family protein [Gemmatimonadaceae bacterium]